MQDKFSIEMDVRDNELDAQGIVNNANYMIYLSHARHKHVHEIGVNFDEYNKNNQKLIVTSCTMKFKNSLLANEKFIVTSKIVETEYPYQWAYKQDIKRVSDGRAIMTAVFNSTCVNGNAGDTDEKLYIPDLIKDIISSSK